MKTPVVDGGRYILFLRFSTHAVTCSPKHLMVETCSCSLTKHASWTCWDRADFIYICKEKTVMRTNRATGFYTSFMTETWEKRTCFQKFLFLRIGFLPFRSSASPHSSSRTSCDHLPASLSVTQIGTDQKASKTEAKIIQDMKILWLGGEKSTCFFSFLAYLSFKVENRIEWCFQPIQVFYHQFISNTNTGRLFLLSGLNEVSCRCDWKERRKTRARLKVGK